MQRSGRFVQSGGPLTWVLLKREICAWKRFRKRRQFADCTGLCPGFSQSGGTCRHGPTNCHGSPCLRPLLIELVLRLVRGSARHKLAVAAACRLAADFWQLATGQSKFENPQLMVPWKA